MKKGELIIPGGVDPWPHEMVMGKILAQHGHVVQFIEKSNRYKESSADVVLDGEVWEMKSPKGNLKSIERNLKRGKWQSSRIIIGTMRMKNIPDVAILRELRTRADSIKGIEYIKMISRSHKIIDIK